VLAPSGSSAIQGGIFRDYSPLRAPGQAAFGRNGLRLGAEHDLEKRVADFRKDHAPSKARSQRALGRETITKPRLGRNFSP
jgi:hypothetical protein